MSLRLIRSSFQKDEKERRRQTELQEARTSSPKTGPDQEEEEEEGEEDDESENVRSGERGISSKGITPKCPNVFCD